MKEKIEKQAIEEITHLLWHYPKALYLNCYNDCDEVAKLLYSEGYRKQSDGEWHYPPYAPFGGSYEMKRCSVCGYKPDIDSENPYTKFCPNCGARMKGGEE